jgi:hypothetical protein
VYWGRENHVTAFNPNGLARILFLVMAAAFLSEKNKALSRTPEKGFVLWGT